MNLHHLTPHGSPSLSRPPGFLFQVLSVLLSVTGDVLVSVYRSEEDGAGADGQQGWDPPSHELIAIWSSARELGLGLWGRG